MMDLVLEAWVSSSIEAAKLGWMMGKGKPWQPGEKLKLLFAGYNGTRNMGSDVRVSEMLRQIRHILGADKTDFSVMTQNFKFTDGYFEGTQQVHLPDIFPPFLSDEVPRHHGVVVLARHVEQGLHHVHELGGDRVNLIAQPQADIQRDLLIAAAAGVDLVGDGAHALLELADDEGVDIFVGRPFIEGGLKGVHSHLLKALLELCAFAAGENAGALQRARKSLRAAAIGVNQPAVKMERTGKAFKDGGRSSFESSTPKFHSRPSNSAFCTCSRFSA